MFLFKHVLISLANYNGITKFSETVESNTFLVTEWGFLEV
jgi:hypothetical protein